MAVLPKEPHLYVVSFNGHRVCAVTAYSLSRARKTVTDALQLDRASAAQAFELGASGLPHLVAPHREGDEGDEGEDAATTLAVAGLSIVRLPVGEPIPDPLPGESPSDYTRRVHGPQGESALDAGLRIHRELLDAQGSEPRMTAAEDRPHDAP